MLANYQQFGTHIAINDKSQGSVVSRFRCDRILTRTTKLLQTATECRFMWKLDSASYYPTELARDLPATFPAV